MALKFPSDEWIKALSRQLNASASYERSAKNWEGDFIFVCEPDAAYSSDPAYLYLGLYHGKSPSAALLQSEGEQKAEFVIRAPFSAWRQVIEGKLDPIQGMMMRKLKLTGDMKMILRYVAAAKEIVSCCALIPTDFGD
jgi:putative sterol carrier protein